jgi:hypothetical protein
MPETPIKVPLDDETLARLRELAASERRATADQAAVILTRVLRRRERSQPAEAAR